MFWVLSIVIFTISYELGISICFIEEETKAQKSWVTFFGSILRKTDGDAFY